MPELPEVETIKRQLNRKIKGKKIKEVEIRLKKFVRPAPEEFQKIAEGKEIKSVSRRAKLLLFDLVGDYFMAAHLKMTGQLVFNGAVGKHSHVVYYFSDGTWLAHNDLRQFGFARLVLKAELIKFLSQHKFGPEPLAKEFTLDFFKELLAKKKRVKIKPLLMDQKFVAGIGNLYADEILFFARVRPARPAGTLKSNEIKNIHLGIREILTLAIKHRGTSAENYVDAYGRPGKFLPLLKVYQREGEPCVRCQGKVNRIKLANRSAYFCPKCQK